MTTQYAYRAQKACGLKTGPPEYNSLPASQSSDTPVKHYAYSADGQYYASATINGVQLCSAITGECSKTLQVAGVAELGFSSRGTLLSTWERPEDGAQHKNLRIFSTATGEEIINFSQKSQSGWNLQYTEDEEFAARMVSSELHIYRPASLKDGIFAKLRVEGASSFSLSPGSNPAVAVFVPERKGSPASVKIYSLAAIGPVVTDLQPISQKTFFKADKITMKWNANGTSLLFVTQTDVDKTNKSYFGETNMYLLSTRDNYSCRVTADKDGPIHDFSWSPNAKEFAVIYGFMPAKTVIFDHRVNVVCDFGIQPRNFVLYNPQGRLLLLAGFGNLNGTLQVWDRKTVTKIAEFDASNTSHCEWSPDGRHIMCATLSPRLRVDNGIRIFHWSGALMHHDTIDDLYQASWRPQAAENFPFRQSLSPAPAAPASTSTDPSTPVKEKPKIAGAYRPPHARGTATPDVFKREDQGGSPAPKLSVPGSAPNGTLAALQNKPKKRAVPGAAPPTTAEPEKKEQRRKKKDSSQKDDAQKEIETNGHVPDKQPNLADLPKLNGTPTTFTVPPLPMDGTPMSPDDKKRRALMKKLGAIEQLKEKRNAGEKLEKTQERKIDAEAEVRAELAALDL